MIGIRGDWSPFGRLIAPVDAGVLAVVRRPPGLEHPGDDLEVVAQRAEPLADRREAVAVGPPLLLLPAGADPELEPAAGDDVDRRRHLGREGRVAEPGADDHVAEPDPLGDHRQRGQDAERLEGHLVGRVGHRVEVVERPERLEAERLGVDRAARRSAPRPSAGSQPSYSPFQPCGHHQPDLHRRLVAGSFRRTFGQRVALDGPSEVRPGLPAYHRRHERARPPADRPFDPERPLPGPPDPWHWAEQPVDRGGPPWFMTEMIAAEPAFAERCLTRLAEAGPGRSGGPARRGAPGGRRGGCAGHGRRLRDERARRARARRDPARGVGAGRAAGSRPGGRPGVRGVARAEGGAVHRDQPRRRAPGRRRRRSGAARSAGARTAIVTVSGRAPGAQGVDIVVETGRARPELLPHDRLHVAARSPAGGRPAADRRDRRAALRCRGGPGADGGRASTAEATAAAESIARPARRLPTHPRHRLGRRSDGRS